MKKEIGSPLPAANITLPGDILAIPVGLGYFAYARVLRGTFLEVLDLATLGMVDLDRLKGVERKFYIEYYEPYDRSPWIYLGQMEFGREEDSWGPPVWFGEAFKYISEKGSHRKVPLEETSGVMKQQLVHPDRMVDRIIEEFALQIPIAKRERLERPKAENSDNSGIQS